MKTVLTNKDALNSLADEAELTATTCSRRGDTEGSFYARGLRGCLPDGGHLPDRAWVMSVPIMSTLTWVERVHTIDAIDPTVRALEDNPGWRLIGCGVGDGGQTTLTFGWPWDEPPKAEGPGTYYDGCRAALRWYAVHRDGEQWVGMGRRTLAQALAEVDEAERAGEHYGMG